MELYFSPTERGVSKRVPHAFAVRLDPHKHEQSPYYQLEGVEGQGGGIQARCGMGDKTHYLEMRIWCLVFPCKL